MIMPLGTYISPKRLAGLALVFAIADRAGTMLSRSGSATAAPRPRKTVRREIVFFVMNILILYSSPQRTQSKSRGRKSYSKAF